jgi:hemolysin activation/secretion protein
MVEVLNDQGKFISVNYAPTDKTIFTADNFAGARADYDYTSVNHKLFPSKGVHFSTGVEFKQNLKQRDRSLTTFSGTFGFYVPIAPSLTLAVKTSGATITGKPEFYQLNRLGGGNTLRGFSRYLFYGKTAFYNQNELQWNFNVKTYIFSGKMGLLGLLDDGRVWQPGETSDKWHAGVGGGLMIAPFNTLSFTVTYAKSNQDSRLNLRVGKLL